MKNSALQYERLRAKKKATVKPQTRPSLKPCKIEN